MGSPLTQSISYHAWNKDRSQLAISPNTDEVWIYSTVGDDSSKWQRKHVLAEHGGQVSGIDWSPVTDLIVTCGHDRNAYVWRYDDKSGVWKPTLVILRINRAATSVSWSPAGNKFAVGSGAKCVPVCHFEQSNDWWISKMIKKHKSTVLSLAWSPNNKFLVTGCADMKCRIFSAYLEGIDESADDGFASIFPDWQEFGEVLAEFDAAKSWVHAVAWSPSPYLLAFAGHSSIISFVQYTANNATPAIQSIYARDLPYLDIQFTNATTLVAAGFDSNIDVFTNSNNIWAFKDKVDKKAVGGAAAVAGAVRSGVAGVASAFGGARNMFREAADKGAAFGSSSGGAELATKHKNIITNIRVLAGGNKITTSALDGRVLIWDI